MAQFFSFLKVAVLAGTAFFTALLVLLSLPKSRLRSVGLELSKYAAAGACVALVPSPIDVLPDPVPVIRWVDDIGYIVGAVMAVRSALGDRKQRLFEVTCENARLAREAGIELAEFEVKGGRS